MNRLIIFILALFPLTAAGQSYPSIKDKPFWTNGYFRELENSYLEVVSAFDYDAQCAKEKAVKEVVGRRSLATGSEANVTIIDNNVSVMSEHALIVKARIIDEYIHHTPQGYTVYLLAQTAKNPTYAYENVSLSDEYGFSVRALIPGMAQIYKGTKTKGSCIIAAEALSIVGIIFCENQRASYNKKIVEQPKYAKEYSGKASNWETGRNISIGVAAGVWIYSIIDGVVAKGKKRIVVSPAGKKGLSMMPFAAPTAVGLSFAYSF